MNSLLANNFVFSSYLGRLVRLRRQRPASHTEIAQRRSRVRSGLSLQFHRQHHFRLRNFRRQSVRHRRSPPFRSAQSGEISVPLRRHSPRRQARPALRHQFHPRAGLSGALAGNAETLITVPGKSQFYAANPSQFYNDLTCTHPSPADINCTSTPAGDGSFSQNVQRLGLYAEDSWRMTPRLTVNYGLRYDTTFGLFTASGRSQLENPAYLTLKALRHPPRHRARRTIIAKPSRRASASHIP